MSEFTTTILTPAVLDALDPAQTIEVARFTADLGLGLSSAGMLRWGLTVPDGTPASDYTGYRPHDHGDLGRCVLAYEAAPEWLQTRIADLLAAFTDEVSTNMADRETKHVEHVVQATTHAVEVRETLVSAPPSELVPLSAIELSILADALASWSDMAIDLAVVPAGFDEEGGDYGSLPCPNGYTSNEVDELSARIHTVRATARA